jgi:hypothetical protein
MDRRGPRFCEGDHTIADCTAERRDGCRRRIARLSRAWDPLEDPPEPLHPGARAVLPLMGRYRCDQDLIRMGYASDVAQAAVDAMFAEFGREAFYNGGSTAITVIGIRMIFPGSSRRDLVRKP